MRRSKEKEWPEITSVKTGFCHPGPSGPPFPQQQAVRTFIVSYHGPLRSLYYMENPPLLKVPQDLPCLQNLRSKEGRHTLKDVASSTFLFELTACCAHIESMLNQQEPHPTQPAAPPGQPPCSLQGGLSSNISSLRNFHQHQHTLASCAIPIPCTL